ncbi:MAG: NFACT family protein, partial [Candidatus Aenigmarchaeota archaeon]|nr:NFACT family protein [Candidatus Aenigmarchaeota archaeon]
MREEMSGLEIISLVTELKNLVGCRVQKIYHTRDEILIHLYSAKTREKTLRMVPGKTMHLTEYKREHPTYPSHFCMYLRKYLTGGVVRYVIQPATERIVKIGFHTDKDRVLVVELFSKGNVILCDGDTIMQPLKVQVWKDRAIKSKEKYILPPSKYDISTLKLNEFKAAIDATEKSDIVRCLAVDLGLGGPYAEECCKRAGVPKSKAVDDLTVEQSRKLHSSLVSMVNEARKPKGYVFLKGTPIDVVPIEMESYAGLTKKQFQTFNEALDFYFINYVVSEIEKVD